MTDVAIAICTWNNADSLDETLATVLSQEGVPPRVLVIDNNSTDHTSQVIARYRKLIPQLGSVVERQPGLTAARVRAVRELHDADWIAFVDDDCRLDQRWVECARRSCRSVEPTVGAVGGRVELLFDEEPPVWVHAIRGAYAEQRPQHHAGPVDSLVGAGMIIRRTALARTGWIDEPLLQDRVGNSLSSGGDVEIAWRLGQAGQLWFDPSLRLQHHIPPRRTDEQYARRLQRGLGAGALLISRMSTDLSHARWLVQSFRHGGTHLVHGCRWWCSSKLRRRPTLPALLDMEFWIGWMRSLMRQMRLGPLPRRRDHVHQTAVERRRRRSRTTSPTNAASRTK